MNFARGEEVEEEEEEEVEVERSEQNLEITMQCNE
jgi:hypothetical protein